MLIINCACNIIADVAANLKKNVVFLTSTQDSAKHLRDWQITVERLNPPPGKVIFCENDSEDETQNLIKSWAYPHELLSFKSKPEDLKDDIYSVIAKNRQMLLERVREINPDFAIFLDDDVFPENLDIIEKLTTHNLDLVGGMYLRLFKDDTPYIASQWGTDTPIAEMPQLPNLAVRVADARKRGVPFLMFARCERKLYKVTITSAGCLCLSGKALKDKRLNFYPKGKVKGYKALSEDFEFCLLARELGYEVYLDGDVRLLHLKPGIEKRRPWITVTYRFR